MRWRQAIGDRMRHPCCLKRCSLTVISIERRCEISDVLINHLEECYVIWIVRVNEVPRLINGRTFPFDTIGAIITLEM